MLRISHYEYDTKIENVKGPMNQKIVMFVANETLKST